MAELIEELQKLNFENVVTLLNSGNIIFQTTATPIEDLEHRILQQLEKRFGFPIPTIVRTAKNILVLTAKDPFKDIILTKDTRLYISFLRKNAICQLKLPWVSNDGSYTILSDEDRMILSVLDLSASKTPKAMEILEKSYDSDITTRNWNTIKRIEKKLHT